jgi:histidinol-phosphatase (PHP family)
LLTSYHNHTRWSDGAESAERLFALAKEANFAEFGFTDHLVLDPLGRTPRWSMDPTSVGAYLDGIGALKNGAPRVFAGLEIDWVPERVADIAAVVADPRLDFTIGSVHRIDGQHVDTVADGITLLGPETRAAFFTRYWEEVRAMAQSGLFEVAGHLDLPKKLLGKPVVDMCDAPGWEAALDAIAASGTVVEVNTSGWSMPCREGYPSRRLLTACLTRGIPVTICGDAHRPEHLLAHFRDATELLREVGYREVALLGEPELRFQPLAALERALAR